MSDFIIQDLSEHKYFSMIPYIIHEIGLDVYQIAVYVAIKRSAGDGGDCTRSKTTLAKQAGNISIRKLTDTIHSLCEKNLKLKKPLINLSSRIHDNGDSDTNLIRIVNIWPENNHFFGGGAQHAPKEEPFKKNPIKEKTTTTPTPSKGKVVVDDVSKYKISEQDKEAALSMKTWMDKEAYKIRKYKYEEIQFGEDWIFTIDLYELLINRHGIEYFQGQILHMAKTQNDFYKGKVKKQVENPERFLRMACKNNYADIKGNKLEEK